MAWLRVERQGPGSRQIPGSHDVGGGRARRRKHHGRALPIFRHHDEEIPGKRPDGHLGPNKTRGLEPSRDLVSLLPSELPPGRRLHRIPRGRISRLPARLVWGLGRSRRADRLLHREHRAFRGAEDREHLAEGAAGTIAVPLEVRRPLGVNGKRPVWPEKARALEAHGMQLGRGRLHRGERWRATG